MAVQESCALDNDFCTLLNKIDKFLRPSHVENKSFQGEDVEEDIVQ